MKIVVIGNDGRARSVYRRLYDEGNDVYMHYGLTSILDSELHVLGGKADLVVCTRIESSESGLVDKLRADGHTVFGASKKDGMLEYSKEEGKRVAREMGFDLPSVVTFPKGGRRDAMAFVNDAGIAWTLKKDGITGGKGTVVCRTVAETLSMLEEEHWDEEMLVLEETVLGQEVSFEFWISDGWVTPMVMNLEYKRLCDGDLGGMTAGMATVQSREAMNSTVVFEIQRKIAAWVAKNGFCGPMYVTFIRDDVSGLLKFIEFNTRLQDPEFELMETMINGHMTDLFMQVARNERMDAPEFAAGWGAGIVVVAGGYPYKDACLQGKPIMYKGKLMHEVIPGMKVMGTECSRSGMKTYGGRQFVLCDHDEDPKVLFKRLYEKLGSISFMDMQYRTDIGELSLKRLRRLKKDGVIW